MAQYDVHLNPSENTAAKVPYLLEIQSNLFEDSTRVVIVPLVLRSVLVSPDSTLNPEFEICKNLVVLFPLDIASANKNNLGNCVANLTAKSNSIVAALDLLLDRH